MKSEVKSKPKIDPNSPRVQNMLSKAYDFYLKNDLQNEDKVLDAVADLCPEALVRYTPITLYDGSPEDAAIKPKKIAPSQLEESLLDALREDNFVQARNCVIQLTRKNSPPLIKGLMAYIEEKYLKAVSLLIQAKPYTCLVVKQLAICLIVTKQWSRSYNLLVAASNNDRVPKKQRSFVLNLLATPYLRWGNTDYAIKLLSKSTELDPQNENLRSLLLRAYIANDQGKEAFEQFEVCKKLNPKTEAWKNITAFTSGDDKYFLPEMKELLDRVHLHDKKSLKIKAEIEEVDVSKGTPNRDKVTDALRSFQDEHGQLVVPVVTNAMEVYLHPEVVQYIKESSSNQRIISIDPVKGAALVFRNGVLALNDQLKAYAVQVHHNALQNAFQVAFLYKQLQDEAKMSIREIADLIGTNKDTVNNHLAFFDLPVDVQKFIMGTSKGRTNKEQPNWMDISHSFWPLIKKRAAMSDPPDVKGALAMAQMIITEDWSVTKCKQDISDADEEQRRAQQKKDLEANIKEKSTDFTITEKSGCTHRFLWMNSSKIDATIIPDNSVDMIVTSPPYLLKGMAYETAKNFSEWWGNIIRPVLDVCIRVLKPGGMMIINLADANAYAQAIINGKKNDVVEEYLVMPPVFDYLRAREVYLHARIIWERQASQVQRKRSTFSVKKHAHGTYKVIANWEYLFCYRKGKNIRKRRDDHTERMNIVNKGKRRKFIQGVWQDSRYELSRLPNVLRLEGERHECPFAPELVIDLMQMWSYKGDIVFDPFGGMGTVAYAAIEMGKRGLGGRNTIISEMLGYHVNMAKRWAGELGLTIDKPT